MIGELIRAFFFIFIAEMGDKTQILAMAFATKYKIHKVLLGVFIGSALNHCIAIILGAYLSSLATLDVIQIVAGIAFIFFGLWGLKIGEEEEEEQKNKFGPIMAVAVAFFIGELGDKTQLTAMALSTDAQYPIFVLFGTVLGMIATSGVGIFVGTKIGDKIPEITIKLISSAIFIFFGTVRLFQAIPQTYLTATNIVLFFGILGSIIYLLLRPVLKLRSEGNRTPLQEVAATLYIQASEIKSAIEDICLGEGKCGMCQGRQCLVGYITKALEEATKEGSYVLSNYWDKVPSYKSKDFDKKKVIKALSLTIAHFIIYGIEKDENYVINKARVALETILFGEAVSNYKDLGSYFKGLKRKNEKIADVVIAGARKIAEEMKD